MKRKTKRKLKLFGFVLLWMAGIILLGCTEWGRSQLRVLLALAIPALVTGPLWVGRVYRSWLQWFFKHGSLVRAHIIDQGRKTLSDGRITTVAWEEDGEQRVETRHSLYLWKSTTNTRKVMRCSSGRFPDLFGQWMLVDSLFIEAEAFGVPLPPVLQMEW